MKYIVIDLKTGKPLYGKNRENLMFSAYEIAKEVAQQLFKNHDDFTIIGIEIKHLLVWHDTIESGMFKWM